MMREIGDKHGIAMALNVLGNIEFDRKEYEKAKLLYKESLKLRCELNDKLSIAACITALAEIANIRNFSKTALKLLGAVDSAILSMGAVMERSDQIKYNNSISLLKNIFSKEEFSEYLEVGKKFSLEQAAEIALCNEQRTMNNEQ